MRQPVVRARPGPHQDACGCFSCDRATCAEAKRRCEALGVQAALSPAADEIQVRHNSVSRIHRRCESAPLVRSRSLGWVIPKPGKVGFEACRLVHGLCDFWKACNRGLFLEGKWPELPSNCCGVQRARRRDGAVTSHRALAACCRHEGISFVDASLDMASAFGSLYRQATEDVIQPRLHDIDKFFFVTQGRRLFTEVPDPDGIASGLAQVVFFMGDKNAPDEFGVLFQGAIDTWQAAVAKKNGGIFRRGSYEGAERSCGVTLFADDVFEKRLLEKGTADECEQTVGWRMDAVNAALEPCSLRQNAGKLVVLPNPRRTVEKRRFPRRTQEYQIKASHRYLGIICPAIHSVSAEIDERSWRYGPRIAL